MVDMGLVGFSNGLNRVFRKWSMLHHNQKGSRAGDSTDISDHGHHDFHPYLRHHHNHSMFHVNIASV